MLRGFGLLGVPSKGFLRGSGLLKGSGGRESTSYGDYGGLYEACKGFPGGGLLGGLHDACKAKRGFISP